MNIHETLVAAKEALEEQFDRAHGDDWSWADQDRFDRDKIVLDERLEIIDALIEQEVNDEHIPSV